MKRSSLKGILFPAISSKDRRFIAFRKAKYSADLLAASIPGFQVYTELS